MDPTSAALCAKKGYFLQITGEVSISRIVVRAPIFSDPSEPSRIPVSEGIFLRSATGNESLLFDRDDEIRPARQKMSSGPIFSKKFAGFWNEGGLKQFKRLRSFHLQAFYSTFCTISSQSFGDNRSGHVGRAAGCKWVKPTRSSPVVSRDVDKKTWIDFVQLVGDLTPDLSPTIISASRAF
jgi:hypothetical protein